MKYIQGQNADIYSVYTDIITFLQSLGWTLLRQDNEAHNIDDKFGDGKTTFMRSKAGDVIYLRISGRKVDTYYRGKSSYVMDIGHYIGEYSEASVAPRNTGNNSNSLTPQTFVFIEAERDTPVKEYMVFADERSIITRFRLFNYNHLSGAVLSYIVKRDTSYAGGAMLYAGRRINDYDAPYPIETTWDRYFSANSFYGQDTTQINNGLSYIRPLDPRPFFYPYKNAFKNDDFVPFMRIYIFYTHTDKTTRVLGHLKDMFFLPKNGLKHGEILIRGDAKYMVVDLSMGSYYLAVKIDV